MATIILSFRNKFIGLLRDTIFPPGRQDTASIMAEMLASKYED